MKRIIFICLIPFLSFCENDRLPTKPEFSETGTIQIIIENETGTKKNLPDSLSEIQKIAMPSTINQLEVRVLDSTDSEVAAKTFTASGGYFEGTITVKAQNNLKVLCIGTNDGIVERFGADENVDVKAGKTTTAAISGWNTSYIPEITDISPNPSTDGSYTVAWSTTPNATAYVLQEAYNQEFSGAVASYFTAGLAIFISGRSVGTCYYRIQSSNDYNIKSGWSVIESAVVQNTHTLSGTVSGANGVTVTLSGDASEIQKINNGESYSFTVAEGGSYTITPSKTGYSFTPPVQTYNNVTSGQTRDFSCAQDFYTISGTVTGADGVMVIMGGDASDSKTVDNGGTYSFTVGGGGSYTVTPFKTGYIFNPASSSFTEVTSNHSQNFSGTSSAVTYTLSGTVSGTDGVTITLSGDASGSQLVNDGGNYSFKVAGGGNYTVTPTKSGYTFTPASGTFNNVTANKTQNFSAIKITYTISGTVSGADGVTVTLSGDASGSQTVNDGGSYSFTVAEGGNYTVTPSKSGYTFTPVSNTFNNITSNQTQNFTAIKRTYTISGTVSGTDGVTITISGDASGSQTVNDGGIYAFIVNSGGNYTITPSKTGYTFTPASQTFNNVTSNQTQNFIATLKTYTISGIITGADGVTVTLSGSASGSQTVNNGGIYSFTVNSSGNYTVTPSKSGYTFTPASQTFNNVTSNQTQNFTTVYPIVPTFVSIPGGTFQMGDEIGDLWDSCKPVYTVTLSSFEMSVYEITNAQYAAYLNVALEMGNITADSSRVIGAKGSAYDGFEYVYLYGIADTFNKCWITFNNNTFTVAPGKENWPVVYVTWYGSKAFARHYRFDLPTESEWEYSCRGGHQYQYGTDDGTLSPTKANCTDSFTGHPVDVGSYPANPYGLYDMSGNVWEWCHDFFGVYPNESIKNPTGVDNGSSCVLRGGTWATDNVGCRSANRGGTSPTSRRRDIGFRVVHRLGGVTY